MQSVHLVGIYHTVGLEHWDGNRGKFVLYRSEDQHSHDCGRFPFEAIPRRTFLDTNVINVLVKYSANVFEGKFISSDLDTTLAIDIEALMHVFYVGSRAEWELVCAPTTIRELMRTKDEGLRAELVEYAELLVDGRHHEDQRFAIDFARRFVDAPFGAALPDAADRELIGYAIGRGCDAFCTRDRATIVKKRGRLRQVTLQVITPAEWWAHIKPWVALWC
jgi:hypothetical protein